MITSIFLFLAAICGGLYLWSKNREKPSNRYRRKKITPPVQEENSEELFSDDAVHSESDREDVFAVAVPEKKEEQSVASKTAATISSQSDCVVVMYLMAPEGNPYAGYELLQALLSAGLRFGKNRIFQRHVHKDGRGDVLFHCASAVAPGTFDLTQMGAFSCPGLSLFFSASSVDEPLSTFDCLLETIDQLVEDLGGEVLDDTRAVFSKDRMVKYRQQIRAFENSKNTADMFE